MVNNMNKLQKISKKNNSMYNWLSINDGSLPTIDTHSSTITAIKTYSSLNYKYKLMLPNGETICGIERDNVKLEVSKFFNKYPVFKSVDYIMTASVRCEYKMIDLCLIPKTDTA